MSTRIVITAANGFIGQRLSSLATQRGYRVVGTCRQASAAFPSLIQTGDLDANTNWMPVLQGADAIIHLAARVHIMNDRSTDPLAAFRKTNVQATLHLAEMAAEMGIRRFIYVSTIKVLGETSPAGSAFNEHSNPVPSDPYSISKHEAELGLQSLASRHKMEIVIVRPPLVYGPGVKANFDAMMRWVARGLPLPFGAMRQNRRSLIAVDNLCDLLLRCVEHPAAANQILLASDGNDLSTSELLMLIGAALGKPVRLLDIPPVVLSATSTVFGKHAVYQRLSSSLQVDITRTRELLDWYPPFSVAESLAKAAQAYRP